MLAGALFVCSSLPVFGAIVVQDGPARYSLHTEDDFTGGAFKPASFEPEGALGSDHAFESFWAYNAEGLSQNSFFTFGAASVTGDTAIIPISGFNQFLTGTITVTIAHGPRTGEAIVTQTLSITNSGTTASNDWRLFYYSDFDVDGVASANSAAFTDADTIRVQRAGSPTVLDFEALDPFSKYQVGEYSTLRDTMMGFPADTLDDTGLPFAPANFTGAFEWDFNLAAGQTVTRSILASVIVPEPGSLILIPLLEWTLRRSGKRNRRRNIPNGD